MSADDLIDVQLPLNADDLPTPADIRQWIGRAVDAADRGRGEISVRVVDETEMTELNREFRDQPKSTNVLSFPAGEVPGLPDNEPKPLGDIVICAPVVRREAADQGKPIASHWAHMLVHGTLHLLGFDHLSDDEALEMETMERQILTSAGLSDPYDTGS